MHCRWRAHYETTAVEPFKSINTLCNTQLSFSVITSLMAQDILSESFEQLDNWYTEGWDLLIQI